MPGAKSLCVRLFLRGGAEHRDLRTHRVRNLDAHVPQAAKAHDADPVSGFHLEFFQGGIGRDSRAQQRRGTREGKR